MNVVSHDEIARLGDAALDLQTIASDSQDPKIGEIASLLMEVAVALQRQNLIDQAVEILKRGLRQNADDLQALLEPILRELREFDDAFREYQITTQGDGTHTIIPFRRRAR